MIDHTSLFNQIQVLDSFFYFCLVGVREGKDVSCREGEKTAPRSVRRPACPAETSHDGSESRMQTLRLPRPRGVPARHRALPPPGAGTIGKSGPEGGAGGGEEAGYANGGEEGGAIG